MKMRMLTTHRIWFLLKYGFFLMICVGLLITVCPFLQVKEENNEEELDSDVENFTQPFMQDKYTLELLHKDAFSCVYSEKSVPNTGGTSTDYPSRNVLSESFTKFNNLLKSLNVKAAIIEPSMLFCMLQETYKDLLRKRNFNIMRFSASPDVITYGIHLIDAYKLQQDETVYEFTKAGFKRHISFAPLAEWMLEIDSMSWEHEPPGHIFYIHESCSFHLVVFYERRNYFWHPAIDAHKKENIPEKTKLLFVSDNSAYEKFSFVPLNSKENTRANIYIPSSPHYFLFQMLSSKFLECDMSRAANLIKDNKLPETRSYLSVQGFNLRTLRVIREFKSIFQPLLSDLWIWSGTMLGWYRQCDIIPYTTDVDFAAWADQVLDLTDLLNQVHNNKLVSIKTRMGMLSEALEFQLECKGLRADIFFMYRIENGSWCSGHRSSSGYYFRYYYPHFSLCSAELLGDKVQVPCETENVIVTEYGHDWRIPIASWSYESSPRNRGPNIYWSKRKLKYAYKYY